MHEFTSWNQQKAPREQPSEWSNVNNLEEYDCLDHVDSYSSYAIWNMYYRLNNTENHMEYVWQT